MKGKREVVRNRGKGLYGVKKRRWSDGRRWLGKGVAIMGFVLAVLVWGYYVQFWRKEKLAAVFDYVIVNELPHDRKAFTQGLLYRNQSFVETIGNYGQSEVRRLDSGSGDVVQSHRFYDSDFAEGLTESIDDRLVALTWRSGIGYFINATSLELLHQWNYDGDGWGITYNPKKQELYLSDGSDTIRVLNPRTMMEIRRFIVTDRGRHIRLLNELEFFKGELWANVFGTFLLARIDVKTGAVTSWIDFTGILSEAELRRVDVMNGIAYDPEQNRIFVTGKYWPKIFEVEVGTNLVAKDVAERNPIFLNPRQLKRIQKALQLRVDSSNTILSKSRK